MHKIETGTEELPAVPGRRGIAVRWNAIRPVMISNGDVLFEVIDYSIRSRACPSCTGVPTATFNSVTLPVAGALM